MNVFVPPWNSDILVSRNPAKDLLESQLFIYEMYKTNHKFGKPQMMACKMEVNSN